MSVLVALTPTPRQLFLNPSNGAPASGFKVFTFAAGTTTKLVTYTDSTGNTANTNPIILDSLGECDIWIPPYTAYKIVFSPPTDTDPPTNAIWTRDGIAVASPVAPTATLTPTRQVLTSGTSATYSTPANCLELRIRMVGDGAGGSGAGTPNNVGGIVAGQAGSNTVFNGIIAKGGVVGSGYASGGPTTPGFGSASFRIQGAGGMPGAVFNTVGVAGGEGGSSPFGGAGSGALATSGTVAGGAASVNSGSGGGGGYTNSAQSGPGGGAGEYVEIIISNPATSYPYTIGPGGAGGVPTAGGTGGKGGSGIIIVDEYY